MRIVMSIFGGGVESHIKSLSFFNTEYEFQEDFVSFIRESYDSRASFVSNDKNLPWIHFVNNDNPVHIFNGSEIFYKIDRGMSGWKTLPNDVRIEFLLEREFDAIEEA